MKLRIGVIMYQTSRTKGQELVAQRMVSYFKRLGHQAYLITSIYHDGKAVVSEGMIGEKGYVEAEDSEFKIPIIRVGSFTSRWPPRRVALKDVVASLEKIVNDYRLNVLITHSTMWNGPEEVAKFVEWRRNIKELGGYQDPIIFCHMSHFQEPSPRGYSLVERSFRMAWNRLSLRTILRVANLILVVTPYEEDAKVKMGAARDKCVLFPGGIDDNQFLTFASSSSDELLKRLKLPNGAKIVAYLGTIEERKNPIAIIDVAEKLRDRNDICFVIAGHGESEYANEVKRRAEGMANVAYAGELTDKEKIQLINASYANLILSKVEALGLTQLEFMFGGVPVVTSAVGGQSWIVRDGQDGIHVKGPGDVKGAAQAIVDLVDNGSKHQKYSKSAKERANNFTLSNLIAKLDQTLTREIQRDTGLVELPAEARSSLSEPEVILRSWSHGTQKVTVTNRRVFIQRGKVSRNTLEVPYSSINSIDHLRRYRWKTLLAGAGLAVLMLIHHYVTPVLSRPLTSKMILLATTAFPILKPEVPQILLNLWLIPISLALLLFIIGARNGYALHGAQLEPVFLPPSFTETIEYIRENQNQSKSEKTNFPTTVEESVE